MRKTGATSGALLGKSMLKAFIAIGVATKIAQFLGDSVEEAREANKVAALTNNVIKTTGGVANVSAIQVNRLADALSRKTGIDDEQVATSENLLLTFKNIRREGAGLENIFNRATRASIDLSAAGFGATESTAKMLGKALNDPIKGLTALGRAGVTFTQQQQDQIKALVASGNAFKAQQVILREVESQVGGAAAAQATNADKARVALANLKEMVGKALVPALDAMAGLFANRIAPALTSFITNLQTGQGAAGGIGNFIRGTLVPALSALWSVFSTKVLPVIIAWNTYLITKVVPAIRQGLLPVIAAGKKAFEQIRGSIQSNRPQLLQLLAAFKSVGNFILTKLAPVVVSMASKSIPVLAGAIRVLIGAAVFWVNAFNAVRDAINKVQSAVTKMISVVKSMPGKIKSAVGNLGHLLYNAGQQVIQGLIDGITSKIGALTSKLKALTNLIPKHKGPPSKDKGLLYGAGQSIIDGLIEGMASREKKMTAKLKDLTAKIRDELATVRSDFASLVEPVASAFTGNLFEAATGKDFVANLLGTKGQLTGLLSAFKTLIGQGLSPGFLYQLFQSGNAGLILDLAKSPDLAAQAGALFGDVSSLSNQLGTAVAGATDKGAALENQTVRLERKLDKLIKATKDNAREVGDQVNGAAGAGHRRGNHGGRRAA
jgi:phage-related protein